MNQPAEQEASNLRWEQRVTSYFGLLEESVSKLNDVLEKTKVDTQAGDAGGVDEANVELALAIDQLQLRIAEREDLLTAEDAPQVGATLVEKLRSDAQFELADRGEAIGHAVDMANHRAVSLFVCQYHLADLTGEILRLMSGATAPPTYDSSGNQQASGGDGMLFNEAA